MKERNARTEEKAHLKMQAYMLLGNVQSAIARMSGNASPQAQSALRKLNRLRGMLEGLLDADSHVSMSDISHLLLDFNTVLSEQAKEHPPLPARAALTPEQIEAINTHPLMGLLDKRAALVAGVIIAGAALGIHAAAMHFAAHHFSCAVMGAFAYRNKYKTAKASGKSDEEAKAEAKAAEDETITREMNAEEKQEEARASTPEERAAIHAKLEAIKTRIHEKADAIREDLDKGTHEHIDAAYSEFVEEPLGRLMEEYKAYHAQAKGFLSEEALHAYNTDMLAGFTKLGQSLHRFHNAAVKACKVTPDTLDFSAMMKDYIHEVDGRCKTCGQDLSYINGALEAERNKTHAARNDLANALAGRCCVSEETVEMIRGMAQQTGQDVGDIYESIRDFHKRYKIKPEAEAPATLLASMREKISVLLGRGRDRGAV